MKIQKRLVSIAIALAVLVIVLGAYTRLTDAGLACPDWPGCYGSLAVPQSVHMDRAAQLYPDTPLEPHKARSEMVHRYFAGVLGGVIALLFVLSWRASVTVHMPRAACPTTSTSKAPERRRWACGL